MTNDLNTRLAKAKINLILEHPFIGSIAMGMPFVIDDTINPPTAMTNGEEVRFHPDFCASLTQPELLFLVAHECMHPMLEHTLRRGSRDPYNWNCAADYVINKLLIDENIGTMPKEGLHDPAIYAAGGGTAEGIYDKLPINPDTGKLDGLRGGQGPIDHCTEPTNGKSPSEQEAEWKVKVAQAAQAARMGGKLSANLSRLVEQILKPKVDWRDVLRRFVTRAKTEDRTWARPNRRFASQGMYLPSITGEQMGEIVVAVDCSGSISASVISQFAAEIRAIQQDMSPSRIHVLYFDHAVSHVDSYASDEPMDIKPHGGGGTAFSPVFDKIDELGISPVATVFLTDLYCYDFGNDPGYPVLWVSNGADKAPFGEVVMM